MVHRCIMCKRNILFPESCKLPIKYNKSLIISYPLCCNAINKSLQIHNSCLQYCILYYRPFVSNGTRVYKFTILAYNTVYYITDPLFQMEQMGRNMEHSMNNFAHQMNHGMNQMAVGMTDMFNNMANSFGQWQVPNQPINVPSVVNIQSQVPSNTQSVVNINSNVGGFEAPVVQNPMNFQSFDMQMPAFPSVVNVNSQIHTQNNIPVSQNMYHNSPPASASSVVRVNNKVVHQTNSNVPHVVNINTHIKNKNGKTKRKHNVNVNMGNSFGAFDGNAFAASINNHIANVFSTSSQLVFISSVGFLFITD